MPQNKVAIHWGTMLKLIEEKGAIGISWYDLADASGVPVDDPDFIRAQQIVRRRKKLKEAMGRDSKGRVCVMVTFDKKEEGRGKTLREEAAGADKPKEPVKPSERFY